MNTLVKVGGALVLALILYVFVQGVAAEFLPLVK